MQYAKSLRRKNMISTLQSHDAMRAMTHVLDTMGKMAPAEKKSAQISFDFF
jgi:hypothetical protein